MATENLTRAERLDRLPVNREHGRLLFGSGIGWALDAMDVGLISFVMAALAKQWQLSNETLSFIGSIGFVGMALGASLGGLLADRVGRRNVFAITLLVYGIATGASALVTSVGALIALRFIVGLGLGAELPVASTLVSEYSPKRIRGRMVVALESFWALGWILAALIGYFVIPRSDAGWRWALAVGVVPTLYAIVVRWGLPESVRFLEKKGRVKEAEEAVRRFEAASNIPAPTTPVTEIPVEVPKYEGESIWSPRLRGTTAALWIVWFGINLSYYGAFIWLPTLLSGELKDLSRSFLYTLIITLAQLPGYATAAYFIEKWGRRPTLAVFLAGSAVGAGMFGLVGAGIWTMAGGQDLLLIVTGSILSFFNLGAWGALYAVSPELYPTGIRGTGAGAAAAFGRLASIIAPLMVPGLLRIGGLGLVFAVIGISFAVAAVAALKLKETLGTELEA